METPVKPKPGVCFEVERIIGVSSDGSYQVQWAPAWVSKFHLVGCEHLIKEFLQLQNEKVSQIHQPQEAGGGTSSNLSNSNLNSPDSSSSVDVSLTSEEPADKLKIYESGINLMPNHNNQEAFLGTNTLLIDRQSHHNDNTSFGFTEETQNEPMYNEIIAGSDISIKLEPDVSHVIHHNPTSSHSPCHFVSSKSCNDNLSTTFPALLPSNAVLSAEKCQTPIGKQMGDDKTDEGEQVKKHSFKKHVCVICEKGFCTINALKNHFLVHKKINRTQKMKEKNYCCEVCGKTFTRSETLTKHRRIHTGERPFSCSFCTKTFIDGGNLTKHIRVHTGEKPYPFEKCSESFPHKHHLKRHMLKQHLGDMIK